MSVIIDNRGARLSGLDDKYMLFRHNLCGLSQVIVNILLSSLVIIKWVPLWNLTQYVGQLISSNVLFFFFFIDKPTAISLVWSHNCDSIMASNSGLDFCHFQFPTVWGKKFSSCKPWPKISLSRHYSAPHVWSYSSLPNLPAGFTNHNSIRWGPEWQGPPVKLYQHDLSLDWMLIHNFFHFLNYWLSLSPYYSHSYSS